MEENITINEKQVSYSDRGSGRSLVLLHGLAESKDIWSDFAGSLEKEFRVIAVDLPGHGGTSVFGTTHSMEFMADVVKLVLDHLKVTECIMIGRSMGGYVALAFAEKYGTTLKGLGLFHSHASADTEEVRRDRVRTINIIYSNRTGFIGQFIPSLFAKENVKAHEEDIDRLREIAMQAPPEGITAALRGMMDREDKTKLIGKLQMPVLFIAGKADTKIPTEAILQQASLPGHAVVLVLGKTGHMGLIEEKEKTQRFVRYFANDTFNL